MCHKADILPDDGYDDRLSAGLATNFDASSHAFTHAIDGLSARDQRVHDLGDQTFESKFVAPPAPVFGGLGPIFNNVSCINCHRNDGGGLPICRFCHGRTTHTDQPGGNRCPGRSAGNCRIWSPGTGPGHTRCKTGSQRRHQLYGYSFYLSGWNGGKSPPSAYTNY